jgi:hypothetical protein
VRETRAPSALDVTPQLISNLHRYRRALCGLEHKILALHHAFVVKGNPDAGPLEADMATATLATVWAQGAP